MYGIGCGMISLLSRKIFSSWHSSFTLFVCFHYLFSLLFIPRTCRIEKCGIFHFAESLLAVFPVEFSCQATVRMQHFSSRLYYVVLITMLQDLLLSLYSTTCTMGTTVRKMCHIAITYGKV